MNRPSDAEIRARIREMHNTTIPENIKRAGQHLTGVFGGGQGDGAYDYSFIYTIGMHLKGFRELLMIATNPTVIAPLINTLCDQIRERNFDFQHGETVVTGGRYNLIALDADDPRTKSEWTIQAGEQFRHQDYQVTQLVIPDPAGRLPWDAGCAEPYNRVPLLNTRPRPQELN